MLSIQTIKPFDIETLAAAASETRGIVSIEGRAVDGGLGDAITESLTEAGIYPGFFGRKELRNTFSGENES